VIALAPIGSYFELDEAGHLQNPCTYAKIDAALLPLVDELVNVYQRHCGDRLHAVYLRGSIPRGCAVSEVSDLDVVGIVHREPQEAFVRWASPVWADGEAKHLLAGYSGLSGIDFAIAHRDLDFPGQNPSLKFVLKTQGLCVHGVDDSLDWPQYKIDRSIAFNYRWLASEFEEWENTFAQQAPSTAKTSFLQSFAKTVVRAGFELVMEREGKFTVDLYPSFVSFGRHYPQSKHLMEAALLSFLNPKLSGGENVAWIKELLPLLISESHLVLSQQDK
jgi:uncharacterized protein